MKCNSSLIKVDWLDACIALRVVGAVLVIFLQYWHKICTILQPIESRGRYLKKSTKPCWPIRSKETWIKYRLLTLLIQCNKQYNSIPSKSWALPVGSTGLSQTADNLAETAGILAWTAHRRGGGCEHPFLRPLSGDLWLICEESSLRNVQLDFKRNTLA